MVTAAASGSVCVRFAANRRMVESGRLVRASSDSHHNVDVVKTTALSFFPSCNPMLAVGRPQLNTSGSSGDARRLYVFCCNPELLGFQTHTRPVGLYLPKIYHLTMINRPHHIPSHLETSDDGTRL